VVIPRELYHSGRYSAAGSFCKARRLFMESSTIKTPNQDPLITCTLGNNSPTEVKFSTQIQHTVTSSMHVSDPHSCKPSRSAHNLPRPYFYDGTASTSQTPSVLWNNFGSEHTTYKPLLYHRHGTTNSAPSLCIFQAWTEGHISYSYLAS